MSAGSGSTRYLSFRQPMFPIRMLWWNSLRKRVWRYIWTWRKFPRRWAVKNNWWKKSDPIPYWQPVSTMHPQNSCLWNARSISPVVCLAVCWHCWSLCSWVLLFTWSPRVRSSLPRSVSVKTVRNSKCTNSAACIWMQKNGKPNWWNRTVSATAWCSSWTLTLVLSVMKSCRTERRKPASVTSSASPAWMNSHSSLMYWKVIWVS